MFSARLLWHVIGDLRDRSVDIARQSDVDDIQLTEPKSHFTNKNGKMSCIGAPHRHLEVGLRVHLTCRTCVLLDRELSCLQIKQWILFRLRSTWYLACVRALKYAFPQSWSFAFKFCNVARDAVVDTNGVSATVDKFEVDRHHRLQNWRRLIR